MCAPGVHVPHGSAKADEGSGFIWYHSSKLSSQEALPRDVVLLVRPLSLGCLVPPLLPCLNSRDLPHRLSNAEPKLHHWASPPARHVLPVLYEHVSSSY